MDLEYTMSIGSKGLILAYSREVAFDTWCAGASLNWPYDELDCDILLGLDINTNLTLIHAGILGAGAIEVSMSSLQMIRYFKSQFFFAGGSIDSNG